MRIDCSECRMFNTDHCDDCLVTALLHPPGAPVDIDEDVAPSLAALSGAGLIPVLRFRPRDAAAVEPGGDGEPRARAG